MPSTIPAISQFEEIRTVSKTPIIELTSIHPLSFLRNVSAVVGSATVTASSGEILLSTTASGTDKATLDSAERGRYMPGYSAEIGIGARVPVLPTGSQNAIWGYSDDVNGMYFGVDATGVYVARLSNSVETKVYQSSWNVDRLDGTGPSATTLDLSSGNVFQILFTWYGYGVIQYEVIGADSSGRQNKIVVHVTSVDGSVSIRQPNLPVRAQTNNGGTATPLQLFVGGRQFSILGKYVPYERVTSAKRLNVANIGTTSVPFLTFRKKSNFLDVPIKLSDVEVITTADTLIQVFLNATLTGASYGNLDSISTTETAIELDTSATAMSGGELIYEFIVSASGAGSNRVGVSGQSGLTLSIPETMPVTIVVKSLAATLTASTLIKIREEW